MLHTCVRTFGVMSTVENFWELNRDQELYTKLEVRTSREQTKRKNKKKEKSTHWPIQMAEFRRDTLICEVERFHSVHLLHQTI